MVSKVGVVVKLCQSLCLVDQNTLFRLSFNYSKLIYQYNFFYMLTSSGFYEKDCNSTQGFQYQPQLVESSFDFVQSIDQFDLEQSCLLRLKAQREKIQELTKLYQENQKELAKKSQKQKEMEQEIEKLSEMAEYHGQWHELKHQYDAMVKKYELTEQELVDTKRELDSLSKYTSEQVQNLRQQIKYHRQQKMLADTHWAAVVEDKQETIKKAIRSAQEKEYQLCQKIQKLEEKIQELQDHFAEKKQEAQQKRQNFRVQLTAREEDLVGFQKVLESFKRQNSEYKAKIISLQDSFQKEKGQYLQAIDQLRIQVKFLRKDHTEKENEIYEYKEMIKKADSKNQTLESTVTTLKSNLKKFKVNTDTNMKKISSSSQQEKAKLELFIHELKMQLQRQMQQKSGMAAQIRRLRGQIERKDQQEKQRKLLLMNEFREIDKMERVVKKII